MRIDSLAGTPVMPSQTDVRDFSAQSVSKIPRISEPPEVGGSASQSGRDSRKNSQEGRGEQQSRLGKILQMLEKGKDKAREESKRQSGGAGAGLVKKPEDVLKIYKKVANP